MKVQCQYFEFVQCGKIAEFTCLNKKCKDVLLCKKHMLMHIQYQHQGVRKIDGIMEGLKID